MSESKLPIFEYKVIYIKGKMESEIEVILNNYGKLGYRALFVTFNGDIVLEKVTNGL